MCMGRSAPAPAPLPPVVQKDPEPAPILKLRKDDGTEETVTDRKDVAQDTGAASLSIPGAGKKKNPAVSV